MPTYEFQCRECRKKFSLVRSISEQGRSKAVCPKCKSRKVEQVLSVFTAKTSRKS